MVFPLPSIVTGLSIVIVPLSKFKSSVSLIFPSSEVLIELSKSLRLEPLNSVAEACDTNIKQLTASKIANIVRFLLTFIFSPYFLHMTHHVKKMYHILIFIILYNIYFTS